jgi:hypothetical protein
VTENGREKEPGGPAGKDTAEAVKTKTGGVVPDRLRIWGGGLLILLLPVVSHSLVSGGVEFSQEVTDNLYLTASKVMGQITSVGPFIRYEGPLDLYYEGRFSVVEWDTDRLFLDNSVTLRKSSFLPGVGNRNAAYLKLHNFFPTTEDIYRHTRLIIGDSLSIYVGGRYQLVPQLNLTYQTHYSDSIADYVQPAARASIAIPLPYMFITPCISADVRLCREESVPSYGVGADFYFPLTIDWSFLCSVFHHQSAPPGDDRLIPIAYVDDPFFETDVLRQVSGFKVVLSRLLLKHRSRLAVTLHSSVKNFSEVQNVTRRDTNLAVSAKFTKSLNETLYLSAEWLSSFNSSTIADFDYTKNGASAHLGLTF